MITPINNKILFEATSIQEAASFLKDQVNTTKSSASTRLSADMFMTFLL
jgi:hypothetical protein